jgi:hypothetical protein
MNTKKTAAEKAPYGLEECTIRCQQGHVACRARDNERLLWEGVIEHCVIKCRENRV